MKCIPLHPRLGLLILLLIVPTVGGCLSTSTYVDPKVRKTDYGNLRRPASPIPVVLNVTYQVNGADNSSGKEAVRKRVVAALTRSGVFAPTVSTDKPGTERLDVVLNDIANMGQAIGSGALSGFTFGLVGTSTSDHYVMTVRYRAADGREIRREYQHELLATTGNKQPPPGFQEVALIDAADRIVEDLVLNMLGDLEGQSAIAGLSPNER